MSGDIHVSEFEALFSKVSKKKAGGANSAGKGGSGEFSQAWKVSLLDGKRQQNAGIALSQVKLTAEEVQRALLHGSKGTDSGQALCFEKDHAHNRRTEEPSKP